MKLSRREILIAAGIAGIGAASTAWRLDRSTTRQQRIDRLLALAPHDEGREIGRAFLAMAGPEEGKRLTDELIDRVPRRLEKDPAAFSRWFAQEVHRDFAEDRLVSVERWQLSRAEVGLCILQALEHRPHHTDRSPSGGLPGT